MLPKTAPLPGRRPSLLLLATVTVFLIHPLFATAADPTNGKPSPLDNAFVVLQRLELGQNLGIFNPIEQAVLQSHNNEAVRKDLENRPPRHASGRCHRTRQGIRMPPNWRLSVPTTRWTLWPGFCPTPRLSHMARYALEGIDTPAAGKTLRESLAKTEGRQKGGRRHFAGPNGRFRSGRPHRPASGLRGTPDPRDGGGRVGTHRHQGRV